MKLTGVRSVLVIASSRLSRSSAFTQYCDAVGQPLVVDDDQQVEVGLVALGRVRLVDPAAARIGAVKDDLEDAALLLPVLGRKRARLLEFLEQDLHHALELALLGRRKMIEVGAHEMFVPVS